VKIEVAGPYMVLEYLTVFLKKSFVRLDITPYSLLKDNRRFGGIYRLPPAFTLDSYLVYFCSLHIVVTSSSETLIDLERTTPLHIPGSTTLQYIDQAIGSAVR
jgi:hypothetical protein